MNFDDYRRAEMAKFFDETDDITLENFEEKYWEWVKKNGR